MLFLTFWGLTGCENWKAFHTGTFNGEPYEVQFMESKGFSTNRIDHAIKLGNRKRVVIDALTTDWGPPYADDLFGEAKRVYIDKNHVSYRNEPDNAVQHPSTMLYLSPNQFSREDFDQYVALMHREWAAIDRKHANGEYDHFPHIIGLVYGESDDFVRIFRASKNGKTYLLTIEPDGRIRYMADEVSANDEYSGLSEKVQMPGKRIYVATGKNAGLSRTEILMYKDKSGKTLGDYFTLEENDTSEPSLR
ncbi:hypothetical protein IC229_30640 [Spirosoma sp. BT702]|uniref:Uncharacterized protein n=1 Tax=Spirosoma profusum TaxID=2771354 RepID=A0A927AV73_9BACT|nr:hypothetical protein [Spirosoma profusum]MBD2705027.1 hypothetical protein [Spirosoma profusum]